MKEILGVICWVFCVIALIYLSLVLASLFERWTHRRLGKPVLTGIIFIWIVLIAGIALFLRATVSQYEIARWIMGGIGALCFLFLLGTLFSTGSGKKLAILLLIAAVLIVVAAVAIRATVSERENGPAGVSGRLAAISEQAKTAFSEAADTAQIEQNLARASAGLAPIEEMIRRLRDQRPPTETQMRELESRIVALKGDIRNNELSVREIRVQVLQASAEFERRLSALRDEAIKKEDSTRLLWITSITGLITGLGAAAAAICGVILKLREVQFLQDEDRRKAEKHENEQAEEQRKREKHEMEKAEEKRKQEKHEMEKRTLTTNRDKTSAPPPDNAS